MHSDTLRKRLRGTLITEFDPGHAEASDALIWNGRKPARRTRLIVRAANADDVSEAVRFASENGLTVSPRGGGHHFTGIASQADMVIDLGALDGLRMDVAARTARVEPSVTNARMAAALDRHDLAFPLGHCGSVPMSGYLLGGGIGWNGGEWGVACFLVSAVEVVLADGRQVTASESEHPDVFWAVRGAGSAFFGIVTAYHVRLMPAAKAISTVVRVYPPAAVPEVAAWAEAVMAKAPRNVEFTAKIASGPAGPVIAVVATVFATSDREARSVQEALALGAPAPLEVIGPMAMPFPALYEATDPSAPFGKRYRADSFWSDAKLGPVLARAVADMALAPSTESFAVVSLRPNAVPTPAGAAFSKEGRIIGVIYGIWSDATDDQCNASWLHATMEGLSPFCTGAYVGLTDFDRPGRHQPTHSPEAQGRIAELARSYDPQALFLRRVAPSALAAE